jgi:hypothetical protein
MADTYTSSLRIIQETIGGNENLWGTLNNAALAMLDEAIAGQVSVSVTAGDVTLTTANNATDQARPAFLILTGSPGTTRNVTMPDVKKLSWVYNNTSDLSAVTIKSGAGTTVSVPSGCKALVYSDGATNVALIDMYGEGTWTPVFTASTTPPTGVNYGTQSGSWIRKGNEVTVWFSIILSSKGTGGVGNILITGLPFTANNNVANATGALLTSVATGAGQVGIAQITPNTTRVTINQSGNGSNSNIAWSSAVDTDVFRATITYHI